MNATVQDTADRKECHRVEWQGITLEIRYDPDWMGLMAHLEVETLEPQRAPLPVTETGYRSLFTSAEQVAAAGGAVALVLAWLDEEAATAGWKEAVAKRRQMSLF